ncbi:regulatory protein RecX [Francisella sp. Scap27]|uniref:regulatory protein RecX n=1 Tax=Francisella sp. Scap27 TaxID=2589986 RepID=UPI0015C1A929|nr:regulatory protein RecX [Francisella sp. Scap27]QLE79135.1 regulatory protein RecX [Francisella sp. Scap27]
MSLSKERNYLLYLLAKQEYSRKQLSDKLHLRENISPNEIDSLLDEFEKNKWLCDKRFAETFIRNEVNKFRGKKRITNSAIYQKGLSGELVNNTFDELEIDWFEQCSKCLNKKYKNTSLFQTDLKLKQKAMNYLAYNGFCYEEISFAIKGEF